MLKHITQHDPVTSSRLADHKSCVAGPRLDGKSVYEALERFKCDSTAAVPTVFLNLLDYMAAENKQLQHMRMLRVGGAACPPKLVTKFSRCSIALLVLCTKHCDQHYTVQGLLSGALLLHQKQCTSHPEEPLLDMCILQDHVNAMSAMSACGVYMAAM